MASDRAGAARGLSGALRPSAHPSPALSGEPAPSGAGCVQRKILQIGKRAHAPDRVPTHRLTPAVRPIQLSVGDSRTYSVVRLGQPDLRGGRCGFCYHGMWQLSPPAAGT